MHPQGKNIFKVALIWPKFILFSLIFLILFAIFYFLSGSADIRAEAQALNGGKKISSVIYPNLLAGIFTGYNSNYVTEVPESYPTWAKVRPLSPTQIDALTPTQIINPSTPNWSSIITNAPAGSVVALEDGTYRPTSPIYLPINGVEGSPVTIIAVNKGRAIIDASLAREAFNPYGRDDHLAPYTRIVGLTITGGRRSGVYLQWGSVDQFVIQDCEIYNTGLLDGSPGIYVAAGRGLIISNCYLQDNNNGIAIAVKDVTPIHDVIVENTRMNNNDIGSTNSDGIAVENELSTNILIRDCESYNHVDAGFDMKPEITVTRSISHNNENGFKTWRKLSLYNSLSYANDRGIQAAGLDNVDKQPELYVQGTTVSGNNVAAEINKCGDPWCNYFSMVEFKNNIIDGSISIDEEAQQTISFDRNIFTDTDDVRGTNSILSTASNLFVTPGSNFHLRLGSPAIGIGGNFTSLPKMDYDLDFQPRSEPYDAGAYDYEKATVDCDKDGDGHNRISCGGDDCNDYDNTIYPGHTENCDSKDNNCNGIIDEGFDVDGDGYTSCGGDCMDNNPNVNPSVVEDPYNPQFCGNGLDDDCSGGDAPCYNCADNDGDGFEGCFVDTCPRGLDCNDSDPDINPNASEVTGNSVDDDCDGKIDESFHDGLIAYYRFETAGPTVTDSSGNNKNGTSNGPSLSAGHQGNAYTFDGIDDYINLAGESDQYFSRSEMSIALWFLKRDDEWGILFSDGRIESNYGSQADTYSLATNSASDNLRFRWRNGGTRYEDNLFSSVNSNQWYHVTISWNTSSVVMYLNGIQVASHSISPNGEPNSRSTLIGAHDYYHDGASHFEEFFNGLIDEVRVYNWMLTQDDVTKLFNAESGSGSGGPPTQPSVTVSPDIPLTTDNLLCSATGSTDPDGDVVTYNFAWYKNSILQAGLTSSTVSATDTTKDDIWRCVVTPTDGINNGPSGEDSVTIQNSAPVLSSIGNRSVTAGSVLQFSISATDDDADNLTYQASNLPVGAVFNDQTRTFSWTAGLVGTYPNINFSASDGDLSDSEAITIFVLPTDTPEDYNNLAFVEQGGLVSFEAEHFAANLQNNDDDPWTLLTEFAGFSGEGFMQAQVGGGSYGSGYVDSADELIFNVNFAHPGRYYAFVRIYNPNTGAQDSCHMGIDNTEPSSGNYFGFSGAGYVWSNAGKYLDISSSGLSTIHVWRREEGVRVDKIILTTDINYRPSGLGPQESGTENLANVNRKPSVSLNANPTIGQTPLNVQFNGSGSDSDGTIATYHWDFGDGTTSNVQNPAHTYTKTNSEYQQAFFAILTVTDNRGATASGSIQIVVRTDASTYFVETYGLIQSAGIHFYPVPEAAVSGKLEYRKRGEATWKEAIPPVITVANGHLESGCTTSECLDVVESDLEPMIRRFIGGATALDANSTYEFRATLLRADNSVVDTLTREISTKPDNLSYGSGRTINVRLDGTGNYTSIQSAIDAAAAGDTIVVHPGTYNQTFTINRSGTQGNPITIRGLSGAILRTTSNNEIITFPDNLHDVIVEGFSLRGESTDTSSWARIRLYNYLTRVVISNNTFHDVQLYDTRGSTDMIVQGNTFESDRYITYPVYFVASAPNLIKGLIFRNNTVRAPGDTYDIACFRGNKAFNDIYNNHFEGIHGDDGIELEGGVHKFVLFHHNINKLRQGSSANGGKGSVPAISHTPVVVGPLIVFNNEFDSSHQFIKTANDGVDQANRSHTLANFGPVIYYHNTFYAPSQYWNDNFIRFRTLYHINLVMKNNIFYGKVHDAESLSSAFSLPRTDVRWGQYDPNYNLYYKQGTTVNPYASYGVDLQSVFADPLFVGTDGADLHLRSTSPAIDRGMIIPNINDNFSGGAPDMGVYEYAGSGQNNAPSRPNVSISPTNPRTNDNLTCNASGSADPDGDAVSYRYAWQKNDVIQATQTSNTISGSLTLKNERWRCIVTPTDGRIDGPTAEAQVTIQNTEPILSIIGNRSVIVGQTLSFTVNAADDDADNLTYSAQNLPSGASFNAATRSFTWTPADNQSGEFTGVRFIVSDGSATDFEDISIRVTPNYNLNPGKTRPNHSLLKAAGSPSIYMVEDGQKRLIIAWSILASQFNPIRVIEVKPSEIANYPDGSHLRYQNGTLIKSPSSPAIYLIDNGQKRIFPSGEVFLGMGYSWSAIIGAENNDVLNLHPDGNVMSITSTHPAGTLIKTASSPAIYYLENNSKRPIIAASIYLTRFVSWNKIVLVSDSELNSYATASPLPYRDGTFFCDAAWQNFYAVDYGQKQKSNSLQLFNDLGYRWEYIVAAENNDVVNLHSTGNNLKYLVDHPSGTLVKSPNRSAIYLLEDGYKKPVPAWSVLASRFSPIRIIEVAESELNNYPDGSLLLYQDGTLIKSVSSPGVYLIDGGRKRIFLSGDVFLQMGYAWEGITAIENNEILNLIPDGPVMGVTSNHPNGSLIKSSSSGAIYYLENGAKRIIPSASIYISRFVSWNKIVQVTNTELNSYANGAPLAYEEGTIFKEGQNIYVVEGTSRRIFNSLQLFYDLGYKAEYIVQAESVDIANLHSAGENISYYND